jgi:hypothetical protein
MWREWGTTRPRGSVGGAKMHQMRRKFSRRNATQFGTSGPAAGAGILISEVVDKPEWPRI